MKRLTVLIKNEKVDSVIASLRELNLDAIIYDVKSAGKEMEKHILAEEQVPRVHIFHEK